jgi:predicted N-acetyltransferase YhbS
MTMEIRVIAQRRWQRVVAEEEGRDVSHLSFAAMPMRVGPAGQLSMAGIGGVGTEPEYRQAGLARRVFARAMEEIGKAGYSCVGLYTGTDIVAHRLYRRFGFVDTLVSTVATKVLDPGQFVVNRLASLLRGAEELEGWRCGLEVRLVPHDPVFIRIECGEARLLEGRPERVDLAVTVSGAALGQLFWSAMSMEFAEAAKLVAWEGDEAHWRRLAGAIEARREVIKEGQM